MNSKNKKILSGLISLLMVPSSLLGTSLAGSARENDVPSSFSRAQESIKGQVAEFSGKIDRYTANSAHLQKALDEIYLNNWTTDRLSIEYIKPTDIGPLAAQIFDEDVSRYYFNETEYSIFENYKFNDIKSAIHMTHFRQVTSEIEHYMALYRECNYDSILGSKDFVIRLKDTKEPIGILGYDIRRDGLNIVISTNYYIGKQYQGKGYAKEATAGITKYLFDAIEEGTFEATVHQKNEGSKKIMKNTFKTIIQKDKRSRYNEKAVDINNLVLYTLNKKAA